MDSPCTGKCALVNGVCTGCRRTIEQIVNWPRHDTNEGDSNRRESNDDGRD